MNQQQTHQQRALLEHELVTGIDTSLRLHIESNAVFLAERLFAEFPSQASLLRMAECYRANDDSATALRLLRHHTPFTQLLPTSPFSSSSSSSSSDNSNSTAAANAPLQQQQQQSFGLPQQQPRELQVGTPRWKLMYLHGVLAARAHQYAEAERVLSQLIGCSNPPSAVASAAANANNSNSADASNSGNNSDAAATAALTEAEAAEAGVRYWLGVCGCHQGEAARVRPAVLFGQTVANCPAIFGAFEEGVRRCEGGTVDSNHAYTQLAQQQQQQQQQRNTTDDSTATSATVTHSARRRKEQGTAALAAFLLPFAEVLRQLYGSYECNSALRILHDTMHPQQRFSGWCLEQQALAFFHCGRTQDAVATFEQLRQREPWRLNTQAMVYFSTCLWHSRQEVALCALAQRMIDCIPKSPFTLCVVGNCHSLNRDSRAAATMFTRATCLDPTFAYAHTLRGHELLAIEEVVEAEASFYEALKWDRRHYAAFAGLGETYFRLEKEGPARENFRSALKINGTLPAVLCRLAATYHRVGATVADLDIALSLYEASLQRCPGHLPSAQQRASLLVRLGRLPEALSALSKLISECPEEPSLHVAMGKCQAKMGQSDAAVRSFHKAMDLDPRRVASVRVLLDRVAAKKDVDAPDH